MDECAWTIPVRQYRISRSINIDGKIKKFNLEVEEAKYGSSTHQNGDYPDSYNNKLKIRWNSKISKTFYLCDTYAPAAIQGSLYLLNAKKQYGFSLDLMQSYFRACNHTYVPISIIGSDSPDYNKILQRIGLMDGWDDTQQIEIQSLDDGLRKFDGQTYAFD